MKYISFALLMLFFAGTGTVFAAEPEATEPESEPEFGQISGADFLEELKKLGVTEDKVPEEFKEKMLAPFAYPRGKFPRKELVALIKNRIETLSSLTNGNLPMILATFNADDATDARVVLTYRGLQMAEEQLASELAF